jgi:outer membrane protein TolC
MKGAQLRICSLCAPWLLAGCTVGPDFVRPAAPKAAYEHAVPPAGSAPTIEYGGEVADDWYQLFHSEPLNQLVRAALADNPDL